MTTKPEQHGRSHVEKHRPICLCGAPGVRSERYDSYYCPLGDVWLEEAHAPGSEFDERTEKPSGVGL